VSKKIDRSAKAKDLYNSDLFKKRRSYAERTRKPWLILSAKHGVVEPDEEIAPYDVALSSASMSQRKEWGRQVVAQLEEHHGSLQGHIFEIHAGDEYVSAIAGPLAAVGASLLRPLQGLGIGEQLQWYVRNADVAPVSLGFSAASPARHPPGLARAITEVFNTGSIDLSERVGAPPPGWQSMPEVIVESHLRQSGALDHEFRLLSAFVAAMDRARDADRLWFAGRDLWDAQPWTFQPSEIVQRSFTELSDSLISFGVSQRHLADAGAWRRIGETLALREHVPTVHDAIFLGTGNAKTLLTDLQSKTRAGTARLPFLSGPKVGPMWIRILAYPGGAEISNIEIVPVAVDVQIRKVSEYLGFTNTRGQELESVRQIIQDSWHQDVAENGAVGPPALEGTAASLDPALWFYGKWGCTYCQRAGRMKPISPVCAQCRFDAIHNPGGQSSSA
jgi:hypothetical protein